MRERNRTHRTGRIVFAAAASCLITACASVGRPPVADQASAAKPYLSAAALPQMLHVLPPAPVAGTARYEADRRIFLATRKLKDSPRWAMATRDVDGSTPAMLEHFSCAMGMTLDPARVPRLAVLLQRIDHDADHITAPPKQANRRLRPFQIDAGAVCQSKAQLEKSFDYPSGHATWGWTVGLVLAEAAPDRATAVLQRARAFADSRVVCGAHNYSAIEAGALNASALMTALNATPAFQSDLAQVRQELAQARRASAPPPATRCMAEQALIGTTPY